MASIPRGIHLKSIAGAMVFVLLAGCTSTAAPKAAAAVQAPRAPDAEFDASRGAVRGDVLDREEVPIVGAQVLLRPGDLVQLTALDGGFTFSLLQPGKYQVVVSRLGYEGASAAVDVVAGEAATPSIHLKEIAVSKPRMEVLTYSGFLECRWAAFGSGMCGSTGVCTATGTCYSTNDVAKALWPNDKNDFFFQVTGDDYNQIVIESRWLPSSVATNPKLVQLFSYKERPGNHEFGSSDPMTSPSWWNYTHGKPGQNQRIPDGDFPKEPNKNLTLRAWLAVSGSILAAPYTNEDPAGVTYQTKFDTVATIFYQQMAPKGYTGLK